MNGRAPSFPAIPDRPPSTPPGKRRRKLQDANPKTAARPAPPIPAPTSRHRLRHSESERRVAVRHRLLDCGPVTGQLAGDHWILVARVHELLGEHGQEPPVFIDGTLRGFVGLEAQRS
jgi:hypothetical protein